MDIAPELLEQIEREFNKRYRYSKRIESLLLKMSSGAANQTHIHDYALETGKCLRDSLKSVLGPGALPDDTLYYNIANRTIKPALERNHVRIVDYATEVQETLYGEDGIGLGAVRPDFATDRADGLVDKVGGLTAEEAAPWFDEPLINFCEKVADDFIFSNARAAYSAGFEVTVSRRTSYHAKIVPKGRKKGYDIPCKWCDDREGDFNYYDVYDKGNTIWQRHRGCRCLITFHQDSRAVDVNHQTDIATPDELIERLKYNTEIFRR